MRIKSALVGSLLLLGVAAPGFAQQGQGNGCTPAGVWYGGSVVAYKLTVVPLVPAGHYSVTFEGMYTNSVMKTTYSGEVKKRGHVYEGSLLALTTLNPAFLTPPPYGEMPDLVAGWMSLRMDDCNNMTNTMPFLGLYFGAGIWKPGPEWLDGKKPMIDAPDVDLLWVLTGGQPVVESYRRLPNRRPSLLDK